MNCKLAFSFAPYQRFQPILLETNFNVDRFKADVLLTLTVFYPVLLAAVLTVSLRVLMCHHIFRSRVEGQARLGPQLSLENLCISGLHLRVLCAEIIWRGARVSLSKQKPFSKKHRAV